MKKTVIAVSALLLSFPAVAQESLVGKYSGNLTQPRGKSAGISLEILSAEGGVVKGKATNYSKGPCAGEYPVEGKVNGNSLDLMATQKGGSTGECGLRLRLTVEGNKLVGTVNKGEAQLSK